ncbi:tRNA modification GTPase [Novipirellula artificiosorum]|uniref:tRNA modification GTPase MnmE n=1 Tax=Novipirellula artificiosorum TaxID=2528016 RepID=A0A5C6DTB6_9BACT|nr:GTPase [Novipirellula artificiosorum]TWU39167.1 tRNA modification GTPase MnmE [Novipirellula artificiosorum]
MLDFEETIVAIASPTEPAERGIVRLSGVQVLSVLESLGLGFASLRRASAAEYAIDVGPPIGVVDSAVLLWPRSQSYTGQPSAEIHTYGSLPVLQALVSMLTAAGARAARPGEFTMRAFIAGRLDLTQAEAVLGVIEAEHRGSLDQALRQLAGNLSRPLEKTRATILNLIADVEAGLDFVDEDIEFISDRRLLERLSDCRHQLAATRQRMGSRIRSDSRPTLVLRGNPNAGKSRLINALSKQAVAIVADVAGTTRDAIVVETHFGSHPIRLVDTAGIESAAAGNESAAAGSVELQRHEDELAAISLASQHHAVQAAESADVRLWCVDASQCRSIAELESMRESLRSHAVRGKRHALDLWVATKADLVDPAKACGDWIYTSVVTGEGLEVLKSRVVEFLESYDAEESGSVIGTAARCGQSLLQAEQAVAAAIDLVSRREGHEWVAAEMRIAADCVGEVTGAVYTDDILDRVFSRFCIGK